jgi:ABC-type methionine transport system ATPase subunit
MKNLYIYTLNHEAAIKKEIWEDVCVTKKGEIVKNEGKRHNLNYGKYELKKDLNKYIARFVYYSKKIDSVKYISLQDDCDIAKLKEPFIEEFEKEIEWLKSKLELFKDLKDQ